MSKKRKTSTEEKQRLILDAAIKVFAEKGFHGCRVSDIAREAGVAYGLVYHYFSSKEQILNTVFSERWSIMLERIGEIDASNNDARDKLADVAAFIIDSYRFNPDLMKVIIVEVTRAANSFGRRHMDEIEEAFALIANIVASAQSEGAFRKDVSAQFASMLFYGAIEQLLSAWIFGALPNTEQEFERAKAQLIETICSGLNVAG